MSGGREPGPWTEGRGQGPVVGGGHMVGPLPPVDRETRLKTVPSPLRWRAVTMSKNLMPCYHNSVFVEMCTVFNGRPSDQNLSVLVGNCGRPVPNTFFHCVVVVRKFLSAGRITLHANRVFSSHLKYRDKFSPWWFQ